MARPCCRLQRRAPMSAMRIWIVVPQEQHAASQSARAAACSHTTRVLLQDRFPRQPVPVPIEAVAILDGGGLPLSFG
eukprot:1266113-Prymnesium_polylepis.1